MRPDSPDVHELGRVLLEVDAVDAHVAQMPAAGTAGCRTGRSGSPWRGPDRSSSCGGRSSAARSRSPAPSPSSSRRVTAWALVTGSVPGRPRQTGQVRVLGSSPKLSSQPQNIFVRVLSWTWISRPMTGSYSCHANASDAVEADRLLERVRRVEDAVLAERRAGDLEADRQALGEPVRDRDRRDAGERHRHRAEVVEVHRERVGGLGAELEGDARRGRRDDEVEAAPRRSSKSRAISVRTFCALP